MPPDLVAPAALSSTSRKLISPELVPPPESRSILPRRREKLVPLPDPYLKTRASSWTRLKIESRSSLQLWMKQADTCGRVYASLILYSCQSPQLNQTGLLNAPIWCTSMYVSSASKVSASAAVAK